MPRETVTNARRRIREDGLKVLGLRFDSDVLFCRAARFETLRRELGGGHLKIVYDCFLMHCRLCESFA